MVFVMKLALLALALFAAPASAQKAPMTRTADLPAPPVAKTVPHGFERHGVRVEDPYHWLKDQSYPKIDDAAVLDYLKAENAYFEAAMKPHAALVNTLFAEMKGRIKEDDASVPAPDGAWLIRWAFDKGAQYRKWYRAPVDGSGPERLIFDEVAEAAGKPYFRLGALETSPDGRYAAILVDDDGSERFKLRIRDLSTGKDLETVSAVGIGTPVWSADSRAVMFTEVNENWRSYRARLHRVGTPVAQDRTIYEETADKGFSVGLSKSQDKSLIFVSTSDNTTSEVRFVPAAAPDAPPTMISPRRKDRIYQLDAAHGKLWVLTNDEHVNFRLASADPARPDVWTTAIEGSDQVYLRGASSFRDHLVISERVGGLDQIRLRGYDGTEHRVAFPEGAYAASVSANADFAPAAYRLSYSSMVTPGTVYDYHPADRRLETRKVAEVPSGYDASGYATERLTIRARDGASVPVSVVYKKGFPKDGTGKLFLYAYGAYGYAIPPSFSTGRLSLLDRGYAYAIAHVRGGDDLGYQWFLDGKLTKRTNTFNDFVDVAKGLIDAKFTKPGSIGIQGGSAGGELMGAVANSNPELWGAVVADVPFVDVLNTMLDDTLPLTPGEWPEWGNPITDKAAFDYIRSYSPYDQVKAQAYPPMLITGGLNDPRVTYWEPAKFAAKLRATKTDDKLLLLKINMGAGHGGKSGRFEALREAAEAYAFVLTQVGGGTAAD